MRRRVEVYCPGSCGELIQGVIHGKELLISYPIELGTSLSIGLSSEKNNIELMPKVKEAIKRTLNLIGIPEKFIGNIKMQKRSQLALGKGMSSSTADIACAIFAIGALFGVNLDSKTVVDISVSIEPTDSIIFEELTLFDSLKGEIILPLAPVPLLKVIVLEGRGSIDTLEYHRTVGRAVYSYAEAWEEVYTMMEDALKKGDWNGVGASAIRSARIQQKLLLKPYLDEIIDCALSSGAYGVNVAHSGTAVGLFMMEEIDEMPIINRLDKLGIIETYGRYYITRMVKGGPRLL